ncbi:MAG: NDP-sugar synthase [Acidobacteriota bacterium]
MSTIRQAVVLAAGRGQRLRPLTELRAKPSLPFLGRTLLDRVLDGLAEAGVERVLVNLHHAPDSLRAVVAARDGGPSVELIPEEVLLGTAGPLMAFRSLLDPEDDFFLVNGDCVQEIDLTALAADHRSSGAAATLTVRAQSEPGFGCLRVDDTDRVTTFSVPAEGRPDERHFLSVQAVSPRLLEHLPDGPPRPLETFKEWYPQAVERGEVIRAHVSDALMLAVDSPERYLASTAEELARRGGGPWLETGAEVGTGTTLDDASALHASATVGARCRLTGSVLLPGARVDDDVELVGCLLGAGARIPAGQRLHGACVDGPS